MPEESVLWTGAPPSGFQLSRSDIFLIPFSLAWGGLGTPAGGAIMFAAMAEPSIASLVMIPFGGLFFFMGLHLLVGRFFVDRWIRRRTYYAITNKRALIATRSFARRVLRAVSLTPGAPVTFASGRRSDLSIGVENHPTGNGDFFKRFRADEGDFTFEGLKDGKQIYDLVLKVQNAQRT